MTWRGKQHVTVHYFKDGATNRSRAVQIWQILIGSAYRRETLTYKELVRLLGGKNPKVLAKQLGHIMHWCSQNKLPPLTILVVNKGTGSPGGGLTLVADRGKLRERVFTFDWYGVYTPSEDEFNEAWNNG